MRSFQATRSGAKWVVEAYDDWVHGSVLRQCVERLYPAKRSDGAEIRLADLRLKPGSLSPSECLALKETYAYEIWCTIRVANSPMRNETLLGRIPRMVGSPGCPDLFDAGYFIVQGVERAYVNRECKRYDRPRLYREEDSHRVDVVSLDCPLTICAHDLALSFEMKFNSSKRLPLALLLKTLGQTSNPFPTHDWGACEDDAALELARAFCKDSRGASESRLRGELKRVLDQALLPFLPQDQKLDYVLRLCRELIRFQSGETQETDVDAMQNKRVDTAGRFIARIACAAIRDMWHKISAAIAKDGPNDDPQRHFNSAHVLTTLITNLKSGDKGASVLPRRASWWESVAVVRRVVANVAAESYVVGPRLFHGTAYGFYCACETQEGENTGLHRETALFFKTSPIGKPHEWMSDLAQAELGAGSASVSVNSVVARRDVDPDQALAWCMRRKRERDPYAGVWRESALEIHVDASEGRPLRPVWALPGEVDHDADFERCVREGRVVWIDADMAKRSYVATRRAHVESYHTHVELHPTSVLGPSAACIPFSDHNPGARNLFGAHVRHQAVGESVPFVSRRKGKHDRFDFDETSRLWYPQRALCDTEIARTLRAHEIPGGWNAVVFVLALPHGQEDAMCVSKRHIDLGGGACETEISVQERIWPGERFGVRRPDPVKFRKLNHATGLPLVGATLFPGDVVVAKYRESDLGDCSALTWTKSFPATVRACRVVNEGMALVRLAWTRVPVVGDKFATRHGQKGVMALQLAEDDTYWTREGLCPDFVLNPACLPTRLTIGNLFEMLCGKLNALAPPPEFEREGCAGRASDCTPYSESHDYARVQAALRGLGFQPKGHETVFSAKTGLPLQAQVFVGPAFMQRLTHFAQPKCYARGRGVLNPQTGQPPKGRGNEGGLRLGEMETKAQQSHGAAFSLQTAYLNNSDGIEVCFCSTCEDARAFTNNGCCMCGNKERVVRVVPRSFMLMRDELKVARVHIHLEPCSSSAPSAANS